ncbi:SOS response-associated peptidase [Methylobacterium platani]|uniref:SOS response-associated peptidase n=1 Tax=Methylobacterium platani TaxID=427683 RepID=UPI000A5D67B1|nr:SOS response-associated peptidase family protein [Methylobacterium platani]
MCNLYSSARSQDEIRRTFAVDRDGAGNLPPLPGVFPDQMAPVVHMDDGERVLTMMRWGFPPPPKVGTQPVTNVRNVASPYWRPWLKPAHRCLVPVTSFSEYADTKPRKTPVWFALDESRPLFAFAGIWRPWTGIRGPKRDEPVEEEHRLFSFLTTEANGVDVAACRSPRAARRAGAGAAGWCDRSARDGSQSRIPAGLRTPETTKATRRPPVVSLYRNRVFNGRSERIRTSDP